MSSKHGVAMPSVDVWWCENLLCIRWKRRFYFSAPWYLRQIIQENAFSNNTKQQSAICFSAFSLENFLLFSLFIPRKCEWKQFNMKFVQWNFEMHENSGYNVLGMEAMHDMMAQALSLYAWIGTEQKMFEKYQQT